MRTLKCTEGPEGPPVLRVSDQVQPLTVQYGRNSVGFIESKETWVCSLVSFVLWALSFLLYKQQITVPDSSRQPSLYRSLLQTHLCTVKFKSSAS